MEIKVLRSRGINIPAMDKFHASSNIYDENGLNICIYILGQHWLDGIALKDDGECHHVNIFIPSPIALNLIRFFFYIFIINPERSNLR